jgi:hypothetical protein
MKFRTTSESTDIPVARTPLEKYPEDRRNLFRRLAQPL